VIVRHAAERWRVSNTGRLAALAMASCRLVDHALEGQPLEPADLAQGGDTWLLYPEGPEAPPSGPSPPPSILLVLDGTWAQARRMRQRLAWLRRLPVLRLPALPAGVPRLRRPPDPSAMSTLEAIARAVALLEGPAIAAPLEALHAAAVVAHRALPCPASRPERTGC
jgi:DTW domain-containing protein YfiP